MNVLGMIMGQQGYPGRVYRSNKCILGCFLGMYRGFMSKYISYNIKKAICM